MRLAQGILRDALAQKSAQRRRNGWRAISFGLAAVTVASGSVLLMDKIIIPNFATLSMADASALKPPKHCAEKALEGSGIKASVFKRAGKMLVSGMMKESGLEISYLVSAESGAVPERVSPKRASPIHRARLDKLDGEVRKACRPVSRSASVAGGIEYD